MSADNKFKIILLNMEQEEVLNFIWLYDQYVVSINEMRTEEEVWDLDPLNIEEYYHQVYKENFKK